MKNKIIIIMFFVFLFFGYSHAFAFVEEVVDITPPIVTTYNLNGGEDNIVFNPNDPASVEIVINADESVKFNYIYICAELDEVCNGTTRIKEFSQTSFNTFVTKLWDGKRSPSTAGMAPDGIYKIKIKMVDEANNETIVVLSPYIITIDTSEESVEDITPPVITLEGEATINLNVGDDYEDAGVTASDDIDGDITSSVIVGGDIVDTSTTGTYVITYDVVDSAGNNAIQVTRIINVLVDEENQDQVEHLSITALVDVPVTCEVLDTDNITHIYTASSVDSYLGICALKAVLDLGDISSVGLSNQYPSMGLFVTSFNDIEADPSSQYWALYKNDVYAESGLSTLPISLGDTISFKLSDFSGNETEDSVFIMVNSLIESVVEPEEPENNGGGGSNTPKSFSVPEALDFLLENKESVSIGLINDWMAISAEAGDDSVLKSILVDYLKSNPIDSDVVTESERRSMSLMALGINPYDGTEINYIEKIIDSFDGEQLGEADLINDDIFGLIVLQNAGYNEEDEIIEDVIKYIISNQSSDGSFGSVDMTSAGIMALSDFKDVLGVSDVISLAEDYLLESQNNDGGFDNFFTTSWVIQALSLNDYYEDEVKDAIDYLADEQQDDGGLDGSDMNSRVWATAYAIPAVLELSWNDILNEFDKLEEFKTNSSGNSNSNSEIDEKEELIIESLILENNEIKTVPEIKPIEVVKKEIQKVVLAPVSQESGDEINTNEKLDSIPSSDLLASAGNIESKFTQDKNGFIVVLVAIFLLGFVILRKV